MHEILFAAAGMRTPFVLADANRAISAPLNIWNDQQDSIAQRDAGWLQIYVENAQEALDTTLMAYKVSENPSVLLPSMVCLDGFILTHTVEPVEIPEQEDVDKFLPPYVPEHAYLDPKEPMSIGNFADPEYYMEARHDMQVAMDNSVEVIQKPCEEIAKPLHTTFHVRACANARIRHIGNGNALIIRPSDIHTAPGKYGVGKPRARITVHRLDAVRSTAL